LNIAVVEIAFISSNGAQVWRSIANLWALCPSCFCRVGRFLVSTWLCHSTTSSIP